MDRENLELLALSVSGTVVARPEIYDRVVRDVTAIRASYPKVQGIKFFPPDDGKSLLLVVDGATMAEIDAGTYHDWDALNTRWGFLNSESHHSTSLLQFALLKFGGIHDMSIVAREYAPLRGVTTASPNGYIGDNATICLTLEGDLYRYVFDLAGGDCPLGCTTHDDFGFSTDPAGAVTFEVEWDWKSGTPKPDFIRRFSKGAGTSCTWRRGR